jgi:hypothetical protein
MPFRIAPRLRPTLHRSFRLAIAVSCLGLLGTFQVAAQVETAPAVGYRCPTPKTQSVAIVPPAPDLPPPPGTQAVARPADFEGAHSGFPRWGNFPPPPQNVPTAEDIRLRVVATGQVRDRFQTSLKGLEWDLSDPDGYQAKALARIDASKLAAIETMTCEQVLDFGQRKQKLATPPPVADN